MKAHLFDYPLPDELIAQHPPRERDGARLLVLSEQGTEHRMVRDLCELIPEGSLIVLNETRVRQARLMCQRPRATQQGGDGGGGGRVEVLLLAPTDEGLWRALGRANRPLRVGDRLELGAAAAQPTSVQPTSAQPTSVLAGFEIAARDSDGTLCVRPLLADGRQAPPSVVEEALQYQGLMPIPPYMRRSAEAADIERYQTVFARELGSVAAPTAGLHLTDGSLRRLSERGVTLGRLVLHVGVGTFRPVTADDFDAHDMHAEQVEVSAALVEQVEHARERGARVVAIGTTAVRALESAADPERPGYIRSYSGATRLLIQPGHTFRVVDSLLTNFHMPKSTLLALVSAFAGRERVLDAYREAIELGYRFLSYGDAMWLPGQES